MSFYLPFEAVDVELDAKPFGDAFAALVESWDTTDLHADIGEHLLNATDERFEAERAPDGTPWAPLSPATLVSQYESRGRTKRAFKQRTRRGEFQVTAGFGRFLESKRILQDKGLRGGLRGDVSYRAEDGRVSVGVSKIYGRRQHLGDEDQSAPGAIPARPYVGVANDDEVVIASIVRRWTAEQAT